MPHLFDTKEPQGVNGMNSMQPVFRGQFLSNAAGAGSLITSGATRMVGNSVVLSVTLLNISGSSTPTLSSQVQGSYDGVTWTDVGSAVTQTAFGVGTVTASSFAYAYVRVKSSITVGTSVAVLFDATLSMSQQ